MSLGSSIIFKYKFFYDHINYQLKIIHRKITNKNPAIISIDDTINYILNHRVSVSRFGEGEIRLINNESIEFQTYDPELAKKLTSIIKSNKQDILVCIPDIFSGLNDYTASTKYFWRRHLKVYNKTWLNLLVTKKQYYNALITRPFICFSDKSTSKQAFEKIKRIWFKKDIVTIEGEKSRLGVGNDLFSGANSIQRIICPAKNAFSIYEKILAAMKSIPTSNIILIALGPTATALAFDLYLLGYHALDIGHLDIEYEWYLMNAVTKIKIPNKYTNEAPGGDEPDDIFDEKYISQIVKRIN